MESKVASQLAFANPSQGFKSYNLSNSPSKTAMQAAPNYVAAIDNNLGENINVNLNDGHSSGFNSSGSSGSSSAGGFNSSGSR